MLSPSANPFANPPAELPATYVSLPWRDIRVSNSPATATGVTKIQIITLYRPNAANAFTGPMMEDVIAALDFFDRDDRVKCIIVTGYGKFFCAGADLNIGLGNDKQERGKDHRDGGGKLSLAINRCRKPTIAAMNGSAVGVGITMTLPMTIRIAAANAKIGFVFAKRGIVMEACSSFFLPRLIGYSRALYLTSTGAIVPASDPKLSSLFAEILPTADAVLPKALEIANEIVANTSNVSTYLMREMMWRNPGSAEGAHLLDSEVINGLYDKVDKAEGINSFLEKRQADFKGSVLKDLPDNVPWWSAVDIVPRNSKL